MSNNYTIIPIGAAPGIQRDGTEYNSNSYIDGQYIRFFQGTPKKIGGCQLLEFGDEKIVTSMLGRTKDDFLWVFMGKTDSVKFFKVKKNNFIPTEVLDITPDINPDLTWNPDAPDNMWNFALYTYTVATETGLQSSAYLFGHVCQSRNDMSTTNVGPIFYTDADNPEKMIPVYARTGPDESDRKPVQVSGGIVVSNNIIIAYGNNGSIYWSEPSAPPDTDWHFFNGTAPEDDYPPSENIISSTKIVQGIVWRGSIIFWSLDSIIRSTVETLSYTIDNDTYTYPAVTGDVIQEEVSIISPNSVVSYNNLLWWIGVDQFYTFNGVAQIIPNDVNLNWFFENVNMEAAAKIWGTVISKYNEIWWFYPRLPFTPNINQTMADQECNAVIIYNVEKQTWYDLTIPSGAPDDGIYPWKRSAGLRPSPNVPYPIWADNQNVKVTYPIGERVGKPIWLHEKGTDYYLTETEIYSIPSYFTTKIITMWESNPENSFLLQTLRIVPDFIQTGTMTVNIYTKEYPYSGILNSTPQVFDRNPFNVNYKPYIDFEVQGALSAYTFASNTLGGNFHMGKPQLYFQKGNPVK